MHIVIKLGKCFIKLNCTILICCIMCGEALEAYVQISCYKALSNISNFYFLHIFAIHILVLHWFYIFWQLFFFFFLNYYYYWSPLTCVLNISHPCTNLACFAIIPEMLKFAKIMWYRIPQQSCKVATWFSCYLPFCQLIFMWYCCCTN